LVFTSTDHTNNAASQSRTVTVLNDAPAPSAGGPYYVDEGSTIPLSATHTDTEQDAVRFDWDLDLSGSRESTGNTVTFPFNLNLLPGIDGPAQYDVPVRATEVYQGAEFAGNRFTDTTTRVIVRNVPPTITGDTVNYPSGPVKVSVPITASAAFTDPGILDTHTALWQWGEGRSSPGTVSETLGSGSIANSHSYARAGLYTVGLTVTDKDGGVDSTTKGYMVIFDPNAGGLSASGTLATRAGECALKPTASGTANLRLYAKYGVGGSPAISATMSFTFPAGGLNFALTSPSYLVVVGSMAFFEGTGTLAGRAGSYGCQVSVVDGQVAGGGGVDKARVRIWNRGTGQVVYDNQPGLVQLNAANRPITGSVVIR
jgi:PKD repeat protein